MIVLAWALVKLNKSFLKRLLSFTCAFFSFFVPQGRELENRCIIREGYLEMGWEFGADEVFCWVVFLTSEIIYGCLDSFGVLVNPGLLCCLLWKWWSLAACLQGRTKSSSGIVYRMWEITDTQVILTLNLLLREENTCKEGVVTFPRWMGYCPSWCLRQWNTASNILLCWQWSKMNPFHGKTHCELSFGLLQQDWSEIIYLFNSVTRVRIFWLQLLEMQQ